MSTSGWWSNMCAHLKQLLAERTRGLFRFCLSQRRRIHCFEWVQCLLCMPDCYGLKFPSNSCGKLPLFFWPHTDAVSSPKTQPSWRGSVQLFWLQATAFHNSTNTFFCLKIMYIGSNRRRLFLSFKTAIWWLRGFLTVDVLPLQRLCHHSPLTFARQKCSVLYFCPKVVEGTSCTYTQPLRGRATSPRWQPEVHFPPASAFVTCAFGSTCTAPTGWERWRWFNLSHISINNSKPVCVGLCHAPTFQTRSIYLFYCLMIHHSQPEGLIWFCQIFFFPHFTELLTKWHSAYCQSAGPHRKKWKPSCQEIIHQSTSPRKVDYHICLFMSFLGVFVSWVNFNYKQ